MERHNKVLIEWGSRAAAANKQFSLVFRDCHRLAHGCHGVTQVHAIPCGEFDTTVAAAQEAELIFTIQFTHS